MKRLQKELLGPVFEPSVFAELIKKFGMNPVNYWRTKHKYEIDFVVKLPEALLPIEVKLQFPRMMPSY